MANHLFDRLIATGAPQASALLTERRDFSYADLEAETARWANALVSLGVRPGDRVAVQVAKSAANLILYLATIRAGAVYLPLNPAYTLAELRFFLTDAEPTLVVCDPVSREAIAVIAGSATVATLDAGGRGSLTDSASRASDRFIPVARGAGDLAAICYTSGTTGRSKGAMLTHGALLANAVTLKDVWRFTADDVLIHALPIFHVHGLFVAIHVPLLAGATILLQPKFDAKAVVEGMPRASCLMGVPTFYTRLLAEPGLTRKATAGMRLFISGSAPLLAQTHRAWEAMTGHAILERYGMTETGMNTSNPYDGPRVAGAVGPPLPDVGLRICDQATGAILPTGEVGMVEVRGPNVCAGYWRAPEKTAEAFGPDGWFVTGDLGGIDARGYLSIVGRVSDLVISGGLNIYPKEIESVLDALPGVAESAVVGVPHPDLGETLVAVIVAEGPEVLSEESLSKALAERLAPFKRPRRYVFVNELPRNAMGKVQKAVLRDRFETPGAPPLA